MFDQPNEDNILAVSQNLHQLNLSQDNYQVTNESQLDNNNIVINDDSNIFNKSQRKGLKNMRIITCKI